MTESSVDRLASIGFEIAIDILLSMTAGGISENVLISPICLQLCTALIHDGTQRQTAVEIAKGFKLDSKDAQSLKKSLKDVLTKYESSETVKIANKMFISEDKQFKKKFQELAHESYNIETGSINFSNVQQTTESVNDWIKAVTTGKVNAVFDSDILIDCQNIASLSVIHLDSIWKHMFDLSNTVVGEFWTAEDSSIPIKFMVQAIECTSFYFEEYSCMALEIPLKDTDLSILYMVPDEYDGLRTLLENLKQAQLADIASKMNHLIVTVKIPKIKLCATLDFKDTLSKLGVKKLFEPNSDMANLVEQSNQMFLSKMLQSVSIELDEKGNDNTAHESSGQRTSSTGQFAVNSPFFFMIWDRKSILFTGIFTKYTGE